jgi:hypothetical protein
MAGMSYGSYGYKVQVCVVRNISVRSTSTIGNAGECQNQKNKHDTGRVQQLEQHRAGPDD